MWSTGHDMQRKRWVRRAVVEPKAMGITDKIEGAQAGIVTILANEEPS